VLPTELESESTSAVRPTRGQSFRSGHAPHWSAGYADSPHGESPVRKLTHSDWWRRCSDPARSLRMGMLRTASVVGDAAFTCVSPRPRGNAKAGSQHDMAVFLPTPGRLVRARSCAASGYRIPRQARSMPLNFWPSHGKTLSDLMIRSMPIATIGQAFRGGDTGERSGVHQLTRSSMPGADECRLSN